MIYVITRTNKRPNKFRLCAHSVAMQEGVDVKHVTISEDVIPEYLAEYDLQNVALKKSDFKHYNNYLDWALKNIGEEGDYFAFLDDDDFYLWPDSLALAMEDGNGADLILWRANSAVGVVPSIDAFRGRRVEQCNITMSGFLVKKGTTQKARFGDELLGDYRFLKTAVAEVGSVAWVERVLTSANPNDVFGGGREKDVSYDLALEGFETAKRHFAIWK